MQEIGPHHSDIEHLRQLKPRIWSSCCHGAGVRGGGRGETRKCEDNKASVEQADDDRFVDNQCDSTDLIHISAYPPQDSRLLPT